MRKNGLSFSKNVATTTSPFILTFKAVVFSMLITALALAVLAAFVAYGPISESTAEVCTVAAMIISVFIAGFSVSRGVKHRGYLNGLLAGVCYVVVMLIISLLAFGNLSLGLSTLKTLIIASVSGAAGGIFGVNFK